MDGLSSPRSTTSSRRVVNTSPSNEQALGIFDFSEIEALDPSVQEGWRIVYDRECPLELRYQETSSSPQDVGTLEAIKVKVLIQVR